MHNTETISIKTTHVDKNIKNLVLWFNGFSSVRTIWSCQGLNKKEQEEVNSRIKKYFSDQIVPHRNGDTSFYAYVVFICNNLDHLSLIIDCIQEFKCYKKDIGFIRIDVSYDRENEMLEYELVMEKQECPNMIVEYWNNVYKPKLIHKTKLIP